MFQGVRCTLNAWKVFSKPRGDADLRSLRFLPDCVQSHLNNVVQRKGGEVQRGSMDCLDQLVAELAGPRGLFNHRFDMLFDLAVLNGAQQPLGVL